MSHGPGPGAHVGHVDSLEHQLGAMHDESLHSEKFRCVTCDAESMARAEWLDHLQDEHDESAA